MVLQMFSVYDSAVGAYKQPFMCHSKGEALRSWVQAVADKDLPFHKTPADYTLFHVGEFDDSKCKITMLATPNSLGVASEFIRPTVQPLQESN